MRDYCKWFEELTGWTPHGWQTELAQVDCCNSRLIRIPTGLGKTEGVLAAWIFRAVEQRRSDWPRRLVWCLPMRVLAEQTVAVAQRMIDRWAEVANLSAQRKPRVHLLMGGEDTGRWYLEPEEPAVLIGTQDMLLSRSLNRGYASARARWPMEFGLLNQDCLWVMDEVQLMDVGLATSAQLQAFRDDYGRKALRPCYTWWMSATLQQDWLHTVDTHSFYSEWVRQPCVIPAAQRLGGLWDVTKTIHTQAIPARNPREFAECILKEHDAIAGGDYGRVTLAVCNTVQRAIDTHAALQKAGRREGLELVHSRFRSAERDKWREQFLSREACVEGVDRIIVATQVIEAGVDISAGCLVTELGPWPSLVQRFGRCARYGGTGSIVVVDRGQDAKSAAPYDTEALAAAWDALQTLTDAGLSALEAFEGSLDDAARTRLYPYDPPHLLMRDEFEELFDTTPDLTGADLDISRFIRSGGERDLLVFWDEVPRDQQPQSARRPRREELCAIPFLVARDWLCEKNKSRLRANMRAWVWDWIDGEWVVAEREMLLPGRVVCIDAQCGGYVAKTGFSPESRRQVTVVPLSPLDPIVEQLEQADNQQDGEALSMSQWKTIAFHASEVSHMVAAIATSVGLPDELIRVLELAALWHDVGKAHPAFQGKIVDSLHEPRPDRNDLAKAPDDAWRMPPGLYVFRGAETEKRPAFRHELASALALFSVLRQYAPDHPALLGPWKEVLEQLGVSIPEASASDSAPGVVRAVLECDATQFDLLAYLVASHHGKVRVALHAAPVDQEYQPKPEDANGLPIRGVRTGDVLPPITVAPNDCPVSELPLSLTPAELGLSSETGASWRERTQKLIEYLSPPTLAFLETILRAADVRASRLATEDPVFDKECVQ